MRPSTTVNVTTLAICASVAEAKMVTQVKRDNGTVADRAPHLTKRENCWTYYGDDVYNPLNVKRFYSEEVGYVKLGELINPPWDPVAEQWVGTLEKCSDRKKVRMLDEVEEGYAKGLHDRLCCDDCSTHGCEKPPSGKYTANSDTKESCIVMSGLDAIGDAILSQTSRLLRSGDYNVRIDRSQFLFIDQISCTLSGQASTRNVMTRSPDPRCGCW